MKISRQTDYALRVLFSLVDSYGRQPISIRELAEANHVPKRYLEHIMLDLKSQGWVTSLPGKNGGYMLAKSPDEIHMGQVVRYFDNILAPIHCVSVKDYRPCTQEAVCRFRRVFLDIRNKTANMMDQATLAAVYAGQPLTSQPGSDIYWSEGGGI